MYFNKSSIIIIDINDNNKPGLILFRNARYDVYTEAGGKLAKKQFQINNWILLENAYRELFEESSGTFNLMNMNGSKLNYIDMNNTRIYIIGIKTKYDYVQMYQSNQQNVRTNDPAWKEMNGIKVINDIQKLLESTEYDEEGNVIYNGIKVYSVTMNILKELDKQNLINSIVNTPIVLNKYCNSLTYTNQ